MSNIQQICISRRSLFAGAAASAGAGILARTGLAHATWPASSFSPYYFDSGIPNAMHDAIGAAIPEWIAAVTWTPSGEWVVVSGSGVVRKSAGFPADCASQISAYVAAGQPINCVAFAPNGKWIVVSELGVTANGIPNACWNDILARFAAGQEVTCVAFTQSGSNWAVLSDSMAPNASGIPNACWNKLLEYAGSAGTWPERVVFGPSNSWVVLGRSNAFFASGVPADCYQKMLECRDVQGRRVTNVAFAPGGSGWHVSGNDFVTMPAPTGGLAAVRNIMTANTIPGVQVAVVQGNVITRTDNYGTVHRGSNFPVGTFTRFQTASVSKVVAAAGALRAIQNGLVAGLGLATNIRANLNYTLPGVGANGTVTLRQLTSHTGGFNVGGFPGYRRPLNSQAPSAVPTTFGILAGTGNTPAIARSLPVNNFNYSGGGYVVLQRFIEQASGQAFPDWMWTNVLSPIGMTSSRFQLEPTWTNGNLATGHISTSFPMAHRRVLHPEFAAAGFYATASDLARLVITINRRGIAPNNTVVWSNALGNSMLTQQTPVGPGLQVWGLGVGLATNGASGQSFWHNGGNAGFRSYFWGNPVLGNGVVVLTNYDDPSGTTAVTNIANQYITQFAL